MKEKNEANWRKPLPPSPHMSMLVGHGDKANPGLGLGPHPLPGIEPLPPSPSVLPLPPSPCPFPPPHPPAYCRQSMFQLAS